MKMVIAAFGPVFLATLTIPAHGAAHPSSVIQGDLEGVSAVSSTDVWMVGSKTTSTRRTPDIEHWDGSTWTSVKSPNAGQLSELSAVSMASANEGFAAGNYRPRGADYLRPFMLHWDGTAWRRVPCPVPFRAQYPEVYDVADLGPGDAWMVGTYDNHALTEHWDGIAWTIVDNTATNELNSVSGLAPDDVWADGTAGLMHWDGTAWSVDRDDAHGHLAAISAHASDDVWAAGTIAGFYVTVHWDGAAWTQVMVPRGKGTRPGFADIDALTSSEVWAVGFKTVNKQWVSVTYHWDGARWKGATTPQAAGDNYLVGVDAIAADDAWAVGYHDGSQGRQQVALHWNGTAWTSVPHG